MANKAMVASQLAAVFGQLAEQISPLTMSGRVGGSLAGMNQTKIQADLEKEARAEAEKKKKRGMFGSIGQTLGTAAGVALAPVTGGASLIGAAALGGGLGRVAGSAIGGGGGQFNAFNAFGEGALGGAMSGALGGAFGGGTGAMPSLAAGSAGPQGAGQLGLMGRMGSGMSNFFSGGVGAPGSFTSRFGPALQQTMRGQGQLQAMQGMLPGYAGMGNGGQGGGYQLVPDPNNPGSYILQPTGGFGAY